MQVYILKRRVASLPPLTSEVYNGHVASAQDKSASTDTTSDSGFSKTCTIRQKAYNSAKTYESHLKSEAHAQVLGKLGSNNDLDTSMEKMTVSPNGAEIK